MVSVRFPPGADIKPQLITDGGGHNKYFTALTPADADEIRVVMQALPRLSRPIPLSLQYSSSSHWAEPHISCWDPPPSPPASSTTAGASLSSDGAVQTTSNGLDQTSGGVTLLGEPKCHVSVQWKAKLLTEEAGAARELEAEVEGEVAGLHEERTVPGTTTSSRQLVGVVPPGPRPVWTSSTGRNTTVAATLVLGEWIDGGMVRLEFEERLLLLRCDGATLIASGGSTSTSMTLRLDRGGGSSYQRRGLTLYLLADQRIRFAQKAIPVCLDAFSTVCPSMLEGNPTPSIPMVPKSKASCRSSRLAK